MIDSLSSIAFINFVKRGNNVFISSITSQHIIFKELTENQHPTIYNHAYYDSIVNQSFVSDTSKVYKFDHRVGKKLASQPWYGFDSSKIIDSLSLYGFESVSMIDDGLVDCFRIKCGKGWFIFHNNPIMLTNYYLAKDNGRQYLNDLFAEYQKPRIYWDEYSTSVFSDNISGQESPLKFILSQRSLRWSWYLLCIFSIIFVVFNSKRKQAHIPLLPANRNTTVEYVTALATLHHQHNSLLFLADEILKQFLSFVKVKYGISSNIDKKDLPRILAPVSGISENELDKLFKHYIGIKYNPTPEPKHIIALHASIEYFYKNCK